MQKERLWAVKVGGNVIDSEAATAAFLEQFAALPGNKVLVHGGGKLASDLGRQLGIAPQVVDGRRLTDAPTLRVVTMVYAGLINKTLTAGLQARGCQAIGMSGCDAGIILAHKRPVGNIDYGFAGDIDTVDAARLSGLVLSGLVPVISPITHDGKGQLLNTNADTVAARVAAALSDRFDTCLLYCFEKNGVLADVADGDSVVPELGYAAYLSGKENGSIAAGMIPKLDNCFSALKGGVKDVRIGHAGQLAAMASGTGLFTRLAGAG